MTDEEQWKFLDTIDRMGNLAAKLQDICPEVFLLCLVAHIFSQEFCSYFIKVATAHLTYCLMGLFTVISVQEIFGDIGVGFFYRLGAQFVVVHRREIVNLIANFVQ